MDEIDELIRNEMERFHENCTATTSSPRPSVPPVQPFQPSSETVPQPEMDRQMAAPLDSTSQACADVASVSCQDSNEPTVEIVEQPVHSRRFRYDCELGSAGAIQGVQSKKGKKSFPKIKIRNYVGPAEITVSLVCKDEPYRVHPYGIVNTKSSEEKNTDIYVIKVQVKRNTCVFPFKNLGIRIVKITQIEEAMRLKEAQKVDPFGQGFSHKFDPKTDDLKAVRLCFQVKLAQEHQLNPVVSDIIYHCKDSNLGCLEIIKVVPAGTTVIIYSQPQQLKPKDVEVVFNKKEKMLERSVKKFDISDTSGIVCTVPPCFRANIECDTEFTIFLRRLSDRSCGAPVPFTYYSDTDVIIKKKRKKLDHVVQDFVENNWTPPASLAPDNDSQYDQDWRKMPGPFNDNPTMARPRSVIPVVPEPSSVNQAGPGQSPVNAAVSRLNQDNLDMPGPSSFINGVPGPSSGNAAMSGLNHDNSAKPRLCLVNPAVPRPRFINSSVSNHDNSAVPRFSSVIPAMTGPSSVNAGVLGPNHDMSTVPEPAFVDSAMPGLNSVNPFLPDPTASTPMQINLSMSPDMVTIPSISQPMSLDMEPMPPISQPMSVNEDEGFFSPNGILENDGEYCRCSAVCDNLINI